MVLHTRITSGLWGGPFDAGRKWITSGSQLLLGAFNTFQARGGPAELGHADQLETSAPLRQQEIYTQTVMSCASPSFQRHLQSQSRK